MDSPFVVHFMWFAELWYSVYGMDNEDDEEKKETPRYTMQAKT